MPVEPVDIEELIRKWAWQMFDITKSKEQGKIPRESLDLTINWKRVRIVHDEPVYNESQKPGTPKSQVLFKTYFSNETDREQEYSFKTERVTRSQCEVVCEQSFTMGMEMSVKLATPCEVFEANAGFHRELSLTDMHGQTFEEEMTWGVDNVIKVPPKHKTTAQLVISEDCYSSKFSVKTHISGPVVATFTNLKDNNSFVTSKSTTVADIIKRESENGLKGFTVANNVVTFETKGTCNFQYAIEQHVKLQQESL